MDPLKQKICAQVDRIANRLKEVSREIHQTPEVKFEEVTASRLLADELEKDGFSVDFGVAGLDTAIYAIHSAQREGPTVAILGEYDALPEIGHACGHNLIAAAGLGAALALGVVKQDLPGKLVFMGTPGEEGGGGKIAMIEAGLFDEIDAAMMFHPSSHTVVDRGSLAISEAQVLFKGKPAHASGSPEKGINALDAVIQTFNGINALRQHIKDGARIHGIITNGGAKPNIVPEHAAAAFYVRALENSYRDELLEKLRRCAEGAALATGATLTFKLEGHSYMAMRPNRALGEAFTRNLETLDEPLNPPPADAGLGSTDMGDVSQIVPSIHPYIQICDETIAGHSREFAEASISERGQTVMLIAAKAMAMTAVDVLMSSELMEQANKEFRGS